MFKEVKVVYGPSALSVKEGEPCLEFDFPASPGIINIFLHENPHIAEEALTNRFKVKSDFHTPVSREQVKEAIYNKAVERLTRDQAAVLCEECYYELYPALKESSETTTLQSVSKEDTDLVSFIRQVSSHWLVPIEGSTDFWLIRGSFVAKKEKEKED